MARRRTSRNYKITNANTKNFGSAGAQVLLRKFDKVDAQGLSAWLHGVKVNYLLSDVTGSGESDTNFGFLFYLTTDDQWSDDFIISSGAASQMSGSVWLPAKRSIRTNATPDSANDIALGTGGPIYLWGEISDSTVSANVYARIISEAWGRWIDVTEYA